MATSDHQIPSSSSVSSTLRQVFEEIDSDRSGAIDVSELGNALRKLGLVQNADDAAKQLIRAVDGRTGSADGRVQFDEFEKSFQHLVTNTQCSSPNVGRIDLETVVSEWLHLGDIDVGSDLAVCGRTTTGEFPLCCNKAKRLSW